MGEKLTAQIFDALAEQTVVVPGTAAAEKGPAVAGLSSCSVCRSSANKSRLRSRRHLMLTLRVSASCALKPTKISATGPLSGMH